MIKTLFTAIITCFATSIDEIPILFMLYTKAGNRGRGKAITSAYYAGTFTLIAIGLLGTFGLGMIPANWVIGLVGLVPFGLGIKILIRGEDNEQEIVDKNQKYKSIWIQVLAITIGLGADDIGVYIPLFTTLTGWEIMQMILVFGFGTAFLCFISYQLTRIEKITSFIEKYERFIIGIIFAGIGMYVMYECGTFRKIAEML